MNAADNPGRAETPTAPGGTRNSQPDSFAPWASAKTTICNTLAHDDRSVGLNDAVFAGCVCRMLPPRWAEDRRDWATATTEARRRIQRVLTRREDRVP